MIYRSNLTCPDLQPHFKHVECRVMPHSMGHSILSDWADKSPDDPTFAIYKRCGFWTHDEAAILYHCANQIGGMWLDIGSHTGWTTLHLVEAVTTVLAIDPLYPPSCSHLQFVERFWENIRHAGISDHRVGTFGGTSSEFFSSGQSFPPFDGVVIDGSHFAPIPLYDAMGVLPLLEPRCVVLLHDAIGQPVREAAKWLRSQGFQSRLYFTPHVVCVCWRGDFDPPDHQPDPTIDWESVRRSMK